LNADEVSNASKGSKEPKLKGQLKAQYKQGNSASDGNRAAEQVS
jgi:hypothetical protein